MFRGGHASYEKRSEPVTITQDGIANDGAPGEGDQTAEASGVTGSAAGDTMTGGPGPDQLRGGPGPDRLLGGAGPDSLNGGEDDDWIDGEDGNDYIEGDNWVWLDGWQSSAVGDDVIIGGGGSDEVDGLAGNDDMRVRDGLQDTVYCDGGVTRGTAGDADKLTADAIDTTPHNDCEQRSAG